MRPPAGAKVVAYAASLLLAGYGGFVGHAAVASPAATAAATVAPAPAPALAPTPAAAPAPVEPVLQQIPIPKPPVVTGLPYPTECHAVGKLPDPDCTPGSVNPDVTQDTIGQTICKSGWTATVRPPAANTSPVKRAAMKAYSEPASTSATTELDHLVPLELGGSDDVTNLWPEPSDIPGAGFNNTKDKIETALKYAVCDHKVTLTAAQNAIAADWTTAEQKLGLR